MSILLTALLALILQIFLPWWSIVFAALAISFFTDQKPGKSFMNGFLGIFILWAGWSGYIYFSQGQVLASRIAGLLGLPSDFLVILVTALVGALVGGISALMANRFRAIISTK